MNHDRPLLIADDDAEFRRAAGEYLAERGAAVLEVSNGLEALLAVKHHSPVAVLLDARLPRLGGLDALKYIRAWDPSIVAVISVGTTIDRPGGGLPLELSAGEGEAEVRARAAALRATVLVKPFPLTELLPHLGLDDPSAPGPRPAAAGPRVTDPSEDRPPRPAERRRSREPRRAPDAASRDDGATPLATGLPGRIGAATMLVVAGATVLTAVSPLSLVYGAAHLLLVLGAVLALLALCAYRDLQMRRGIARRAIGTLIERGEAALRTWSEGLDRGGGDADRWRTLAGQRLRRPPFRAGTESRVLSPGADGLGESLTALRQILDRIDRYIA